MLAGPSPPRSLSEAPWEPAFSVRVTDSHLGLIFPSGLARQGRRRPGQGGQFVPVPQRPFQ